ncbi:lupeol synthase-like isoform X1 [Chenopodium quinoa]|uniref:Terpene cyclase/mutase family member n=1 Tax=Chenopodium quinoa TaxID=63459 RepID=A0A803LZ37_CHEQI|nr:lupeol synthase-like isoform X1 [Chenopodium quinoa]
MWKLKIAEGKDPWLESLNNFTGRQHWEFDPEAGTTEERAEVERAREEFKRNRFNMRQSADLLMRMELRKGKPLVEMAKGVKLKEREVIGEEAVTTTLKKAINFFTSIQAHDGHWPSDNAGPLYFMPPLVMALYVTGDLNKVLSPEHQKETKRYIYNHQNDDGGWGFHIDSHSTMFGSAISYIALRLLGEGPDDGEDNAVARGRQWILDHGGATSIPSWGKFWLSVLGVYEWDGCNPTPPELWLLPDFLPMHPGKTLSYCRLVYMPVSYMYGRRFVGPITELIQSLRTEIYPHPYHEINWNKARNSCAKEDLYAPHHVLQDMIWGFLHHVGEPILNRWPFSKLREKALKTAIANVHYEDVNSRYCCIGCVEKVLCLMACWAEDPNSTAYKKHLARIPDYLWVSEDGMKFTALGCQTWDAALAFHAIHASGLTDEYATPLKKTHSFLKASQVRENPSGNFKEMYRHISKGSWTFSTPDHGWQVSDCTAEGLKVALLFAKMFPELEEDKMEAGRLFDAVNVILSLQGENGGFTAWEPQRTYRWIEKFNPTELFDDVLIEREHVECTSSIIQAFTLFKEQYPDHRTKEIEDSISRGIQYIERAQNPDGSWYGFWGICFTYGTWFAVEALLRCNKNYHNSQAVKKACEFILSKQLPNGGWGESYLSSSNEVYTNLKGNKSNLVQTSWALLTLIRAGQWEVNPDPVDRGMRLVINSQMENGDFPPQESTGIFMKSCIIEYSSYRCIFPIWVLSEYRRAQAQRSAIQ